MKDKNDYPANEYSFIDIDTLKGCFVSLLFILFVIGIIIWIFFEVIILIIEYIK